MGSLAQPCVVNNTFFSLWGGQKWGFYPKDPTYRAFLHNKLFLLIAPRDLHYYWASAQPCAALRSLGQLTTSFLASGKAAILREKTPFLALPEAKKGVVNCPRLRTGPIIMQIPRGYQKKKVYRVESLRFCR